MKIFHIGVSACTLSALVRLGYYSRTCAFVDLTELVDVIASEAYDALVVDASRSTWLYSSISKLRKKGLAIPIIAMDVDSFGDWSMKRAEFLDAGGDDLIRHPETALEIAASIRAVIRRMRDRSSDERIFRYGNASLHVHFRKYEVSVNEVTPYLTAFELKILIFLAENISKPCSRTAISDYLHDFEECPDNNTIEVLITRLRKKLGNICADAVGMIETIRGVGYRLNTEQ